MIDAMEKKSTQQKNQNLYYTETDDDFSEVNEDNLVIMIANQEHGNKNKVGRAGDDMTKTTENKKKKKNQAVAKIVYEGVHPRLTKLPGRTACRIATVVIIVNAVFVTLVTLYNWANVNVKLAVLDAEWTGIDAYRTQFHGPTHLCNSYGPSLQDDGQVFYIQPCLLSGLTCEHDYGDEFCPSEVLPFACSNDLPICGTLGSFASVVYVDGASFPVAFGSAMGYLMYVQAAVLIVCLVVYYMCCGQRQGARVSDLKHDVRAVALGLVQV